MVQYVTGLRGQDIGGSNISKILSFSLLYSPTMKSVNSINTSLLKTLPFPYNFIIPSIIYLEKIDSNHVVYGFEGVSPLKAVYIVFNKSKNSDGVEELKERFRVEVTEKGGIIITEIPLMINGKPVYRYLRVKHSLYIAPVEVKNDAWRKKVQHLPKYLQKFIEKLVSDLQ